MRRTIGLIAALLLAVQTSGAHALPHLVVDLTNDRVLEARQAFHPWHPASLTKMMTAYTVFRAIERGRFDPKTPIKMTWWAAQQSPSKMFYRPGTLIPLDDALTMLMVKSANDVSMAIAETVGGSTEGFAAMMNEAARELGMKDSYFVNPHGLHHPRQVTTARDMALLVRALAKYPDWKHLFTTSRISYRNSKGKMSELRSFNTLLERFAGTDGMKTGYVCPSGFNIAATATRDGRRLLAVVFGRNSGIERAKEAAKLLQLGFENETLPPETATLDALAPQGTVPSAPRNMRQAVCETENAPKVELQVLPAGIHGPPGPPRIWLAPRVRQTPRVVKTVGTANPWPRLSSLTRIATPTARPDPNEARAALEAPKPSQP